MPSSGYVPCAGTVPQNLGRTVSTGGSVEPTHSVPDTSYPPGEEQQTLDDTGGSVDPTHSVGGVFYPPGEETETVRQTAGGTGPVGSGPWQNDSDASVLPPLVSGITATDTTVVPPLAADGTIYTHPIGPESYTPPSGPSGPSGGEGPVS